MKKLIIFLAFLSISISGFSQSVDSLKTNPANPIHAKKPNKHLVSASVTGSGLALGSYMHLNSQSYNGLIFSMLTIVGSIVTGVLLFDNEDAKSGKIANLQISGNGISLAFSIK